MSRRKTSKGAAIHWACYNFKNSGEKLIFLANDVKNGVEVDEREWSYALGMIHALMDIEQFIPQEKLLEEGVTEQLIDEVIESAIYLGRWSLLGKGGST